MNQFLDTLASLSARSDRIGLALTRIGVMVVLFWIGGLKICKYEADGIVPFVANSPVMSFFYAHSAPEYKAHMNPEGVLVVENRVWHENNGTYRFSLGLGAVIVLYGILLGLHPWRPDLATLGAFLVMIMSLVTLSFLITTPECWVPDLGDSDHGFPYLSGRGRLVIKDLIMLGASMVLMSQSARSWQNRRERRAIERNRVGA